MLLYGGEHNFSPTHLFRVVEVLANSFVPCIESFQTVYCLCQVIRKSSHIKPQQSCDKSPYQSKLVFFNLIHLFTVLMSIFDPAKAVCRKIFQRTLPGISVPNIYLGGFLFNKSA